MSFRDPYYEPVEARRPPVSKTVVVLVAILGAVAVVAWRREIIGLQELILFAVFVPSVIVHEVMHGVVANHFGDPTARNAGRLSFNPLRHIDPFGTIILPIILVITTPIAFGYAKPVPVNVGGMSKNKAMLVSLAGPGVNFLMAAIALLLIHWLGLGVNIWVLTVLAFFGLINVVLGVFNSIPIPPLDGSAVIERFLPYRYLSGWYQIRRFSIIVLLAIMLLRPQTTATVIGPFIQFYEALLPS